MKNVKYALLVEDNPSDVLLTKVNLETLGYVALLANDGFAALDILETHPVELIVVDLNLPQMTGLDLLRRIKANLQWKSTPTLVVSAKNSLKDVKAAIETGAQDYIVKPLDMSVFKQKVEALSKNFTDKWYSYDIPEGSPHAQVMIRHLQKLLSINEMGCSLLTTGEHAEGELLHIYSEAHRAADIPETLARVMACQKVDRGYLIHTVFVGLTEASRAHLRRYCMKIWHEKNESKTI